MMAQVIDRTAVLLAADGAEEAVRLLRSAAEGTTQRPDAHTALTVVMAGVLLEHCPVTPEAALRTGHALAAAATRRLALLPMTPSPEAADVPA